MGVFLACLLLLPGLALGGQTTEEQVAVEVAVESEGRPLVGMARYLGFFQLPASQAMPTPVPPLEEKLLEPKETAWKTQIPPGTYALVCGAEGYGMRVMPVEISGGKRATLRCPVSQLVPVTGTVVEQASKRPLAGATVQLLSLELGDTPYTSELLAQHLAAKHAATTDEAGRFRVWALPGEQGFWVARAPRFGRRVFPVKPAKNGVDVGAVALEEAAAVEVEVQLSPEELRTGHWWLELVRRSVGGADVGATTPSEEELAARALFCKKVGEDGRVRFEEVPPGEYGLLLTTITSRLLRQTKGRKPPDVPYEPSDYLGPVYLPPGGVQHLSFAPPRIALEVQVAGLSAEKQEEFVPFVFNQDRNYGTKGNWLGGDEGGSRFSVVLPAEGTWLVRLRKEGGSKPAHLTLGRVTVHRFQKSVRASFVFASSVLSGKVLDAAGKPVYWAAVAVSGKKPCSPQNFTWRGHTDKEGVFQVPTVPQEPLVVWVYHPSGSAYLELEAPREDLVISLTEGRTVSLLLEDEDGNPAYDGVQARFRPEGVGMELGVGAPPNTRGELVVNQLPDVDGELLVLDHSWRQPQLAPLKLKLPKGKKGFLGAFRLQRGGRLVWRGKLEFLEGAAAVGLEHEDLLFGLFPNSNESLLLGAPQGLVSSLDYKNLPPGFWRVVAVDETCNILRSSKRVLIHSGQTTVISP